MAFNSKEYSWSDLNVAVNGKIMTKCVAIEYGEKIDREYVRGMGRMPIDINDGDVDVSGVIEFKQSDFEDLLVLTGNIGVRGLRDLDVTVAYSNTGGRISIRNIIGVACTEWKEGYKSGDKSGNVLLPFMALDVKGE